MANVILPASNVANIRTYDFLDQIVAVLGTTKMTFFPFFMHEAGNGATPIRAHNSVHFLNPHDETGSARILQSEHLPYRHPGGIYSYNFNASDDLNLRGDDHADYEFPGNTPYSVGCWIYPRDITTVTLVGKYDINVQREWRLQLDGTSHVELESFDETNNQSRIGAGDTAVIADQWSFVVATFDGADADASMSFFLNGAADGSGNTESGAAYASQPGTTAALTVGATHNTTPVVVNQFTGRVALPFVTGIELSATQVAELDRLGRILLGL